MSFSKSPSSPRPEGGEVREWKRKTVRDREPIGKGLKKSAPPQAAHLMVFRWR